MTDDRQAIRDMIRESAAAVSPPGGGLARIRALRFAEPGFDRPTWRTVAELGWVGLRVPEEDGGSGLGTRESVVLLEELGGGLVPEPLVDAGVSASLLAHAGEADLLAALLAGESLVATTLPRSPVLPDGAHHAAMGGAADHYLVADEAAGTLSLVAAADVATTRVGLQDGGFLATIVPGAARLVASDASAAIRRAYDEAALGTAAYLLGLSERLFAMTVDYLGQRRQFDQPLASFQALQHRCADMKIQLSLTRASVNGAASDLDSPASADLRAMAVSRAKVRAADTAMLVAREAIQMHGAIACTDEYDAGLYVRKAMVLANAYGSTGWHRARHARLDGRQAA